jgi:hypothetical protein
MLSEHNPRRTWQGGGQNWAGRECALMSSVVAQDRLLSPLVTCGIIATIKILLVRAGEPSCSASRKLA